ncbi:centromere protein C [Porphyrio hochstetteri]
MADALNLFKNDYRARFCHGGGNEIAVQPGQNVLKLIEDCFESCGSDLTVRSPNATYCVTPVRNEKRTSIQSQRPEAGLTNSVKKACNSAKPLPASPVEPVSSRGWSPESPLKPAKHYYIAESKETKSPVPKGETNNILKDVEVLCRSPAMSSDPNNDHRYAGSPLHVQLQFDDQNAVSSHMEVENLERPQAGRDEQVGPRQGTECHAASSVRKEKPFSSVILAAVATRTAGKRYSASISPPSPPPLKDQDTESENECEFLIDESHSASFNSWFSISSKKKKQKKDVCATPVSKSQPSKRDKTESKKGKNRKVQVEALTKQKIDDLDLRAHDFKGTSKSDPLLNSEGKVPKSQRQNSTHTRKTKKDALRHGSANQKKKTTQKPEAQEVMSHSGLETKLSDAEPRTKKVMPSEVSPVPSAGHQQEQTVSPRKSLKSSKCLKSVSKAAQHLVHKKETAKQKLPKDTVAERLAASPKKELKKSGKKSSTKKPRLQRQETSDTQPGEEELEREPVKLNEVFTSPPRQKRRRTSVVRQLAESEKPKNVSHVLEALDGASKETPVKALQHLMDSVKNPKKKRPSAKSSGEKPKRITHRTSKGDCSNPECQRDSDSSPAQDTAKKSQKLPDVKIKSNKRKRTAQHGLQDSLAAEKPLTCESGPVLEHCDISALRSESCEKDNISSDSSEDLNWHLKNLLSDNLARHKIVMPSNTPNVRRTKRIRLRPLEYWRGERVNYTMSSSGGLVFSGIVCPEPEPYRKIQQRKQSPKQKRNEMVTEIPASLDHSLADTSKPTIVLDPETRKEILLECINTESNYTCFCKNESIEIYKNLNTPAFATGRLILKPFKEKGQQFVHKDTIAFYIFCGKIIVTLHRTSYILTTGDYFYVPAGNSYNIHNLLNEDCVLLFTQFKRDRPKAISTLLETSSP